MFNFFKFSKKDLLPNEKYSESIIEYMRSKNIRQKDFEEFKSNAKIIAHDCPSYSHTVDFFHFINKAINYQVYKVVKNKFDLDFYYQELVDLYNYGSQFIGQQQLKILIDSLEIAYPTIVSFMKYETGQEEIRKKIIEEAGFVYTRHIYPDYSGMSELFYDIPFGPEDPVYDEAKKILKERKNSQKNNK